MHNKDVSQSISHTLMLTLMMLVLSGCLSEEESETAFSGSSGSTPVNGAPVISGNPAGAVKIGEAYSFTPNASDTDNDPLTFAIESKPLWASFDTDTGELSGQPTLGNVGTYSNILISVRDATASASLARFSITVNQVGTLSTTLSWTPPIENEDGTVLTDLDGYKIYWGTTPGNYPNSVTISNEGITTYVVDNLTPGTYEFVATSFNASGVESVYSNPTTKVVN
jgi:hypothetical protein